MCYFPSLLSEAIEKSGMLFIEAKVFDNNERLGREVLSEFYSLNFQKRNGSYLDVFLNKDLLEVSIFIYASDLFVISANWVKIYENYPKKCAKNNPDSRRGSFSKILRLKYLKSISDLNYLKPTSNGFSIYKHIDESTRGGKKNRWATKINKLSIKIN